MNVNGKVKFFNEAKGYETATLTSANAYALSTLYRGLYGTAIASHASGAPFVRLDSAVFEYDLPSQYVGQTLHIKLQSFNVFGGGVQDLSTCTAYTYTPTGVAVDHPVARATLVGSPLDFGLVVNASGVADDFGNPLTLSVDLDADLGVA